MPEMIKAGNLKVGDKFRVEATVTSVGNNIVYCNRDFTVQTHVEVELIERAMPKFEPGGILRYCHDSVNYPHNYVDWVVITDNMATKLGSSTFKTINSLNDDITNGLSINTTPHRWTYFPPATANDNGTRLG